MKKIIIIILVLALLIGGSVGGAAMMGIAPFDKLLMGHKGEAKKEEAPAVVVAPPPSSAYYDVGSYIIPVVQNHMIAHQVGIDLAIEVAPDQVTRVGAALPRLEDAFTTELFNTIPAYHDSKSQSDRRIIHDRLQRVANKMFGEGAVRDVTIKSIYDR